MELFSTVKFASVPTFAGSCRTARLWGCSRRIRRVLISFKNTRYGPGRVLKAALQPDYDGYWLSSESPPCVNSPDTELEALAIC